MQTAQTHRPVVRTERRAAAFSLTTLWERFTPLDQALQLDGDERDYTQAFQVREPSRYRLNELPRDYGIDDFVASWN